MQLINKQDDLALALSHFLQNGFQTFLKLAPIFCSRHQSSHIQRKNLFILQTLRDIPPDNTLCQTFHNGGLTYAGLSDQNRIILRLSGQDADHVADFRITADHRIHFLISGLLHQVFAILIQRIVSNLRIVCRYPLIAPDCGKRLQKTLFCDAVFLEEGFHGRAGMIQQGQEQMLHGDILISHGFRLILRAHQSLIQILSNIRLPSGNLRSTVQKLLQTVLKMLLLDFHLLYQLQDQTVFLFY